MMKPSLSHFPTFPLSHISLILVLLIFSGCPQPQKPDDPQSDSTITTRPSTSRETPEEKAVRERVEQLGGTIRKNQQGTIVGLTIENTAQLTLVDMQTIAKLSELESIRLMGSAVNDKYVEAISGLPKLKSVDIESSNISDKSLNFLKTLPEIETLAIRQNVELTDNAIKILAEFPNLRKLSILYNKFSPASLLGLGKLKSVRFLDLRGLQVGDDTLMFIAKLENLEEIHIRSTLVSDFGIEQLQQCKNLKILELQDTSISSDSPDAFKEMKNLSYLRIFRAPEFGAREIAKLGALTNLETLELRALNCSNEALKALKSLTGLKTVEFSELTDVGAETIIDVLKAYPKLESIRMFAMLTVDDSVAEYLATVPALKSVALPVTSITDKGLDALTAITNLQTLDIFGNKELITLQGARVLTKFRNLRRLILPETLDHEVLKANIMKASPRCVITIKTYSQEG